MSAAEIPILFEDKFLVVCLKPAGVLSEDGGMPELLAAQCGCPRVYCVHRLDKAVGGVMVCAKDGKTSAMLSEQFGSRSVTKEYLAVVPGVPEPACGTLRDFLYHDAAKNKTYVVSRPRRGVKEASLDYFTEAQVSGGEIGTPALLRVTLHTGRSHQIRAQFAARKLPLLGDGRYGSAVRDCGIALQSHRLAFIHPVTGEALDFSAPRPEAWPWTLFRPEAAEKTENAERTDA